MIYEYNDVTLQEVFVANPNGKQSFVVLLPVTRTGPENIRNWERISGIIQNSEVSALVVLDKTPFGEATEYFSKHVRFSHADIYLVRRKPGEAIYDSQSVVVIDSNLWILQLHDDDQWEGVLSFPFSPSGMQLFSPKFVISGKHRNLPLDWTLSPPARINFTALPDSVWNRFTLFIRSQGGHAAGSVDSTLNLVRRLICGYAGLEEFTYTYDNRHWESQRRAKHNLEKLALEDGWGFLASEEIQLLNRRIDALAAVEFFKDLMPYDSKRTESSLLLDFGLSFKKRIHLRLRLLHNSLLERIFAFSFIEGLDSLVATKQIKITNQITIDKLIIFSTKVESRQDVLCLVNFIRDLGDFPILVSRFNFWEITLK
jgi:hypothetical protein